MTPILIPFLLLAVLGLILSIVSHVAAIAGAPQPLGEEAWALHIGIFVVWIPAVIVANRLSRDVKQKDLWKAVLRGCPPWMRWMTYGFFAYAVINFAIFFASAPRRGAAIGAGAPPEVFRGFSGHWMAFYSAAAAILYSAISVTNRDPARRCPNGHPVSPSAKYCEACGTPIDDDQRQGLSGFFRPHWQIRAIFSAFFSVAAPPARSAWKITVSLAIFSAPTDEL